MAAKSCAGVRTAGAVATTGAETDERRGETVGLASGPAPKEAGGVANNAGSAGPMGRAAGEKDNKEKEKEQGEETEAARKEPA